MGCHKGSCGHFVSRQRRPTIKTKPAKPEQSSTDECHRQAMGNKTSLPVSTPWTYHQDCSKSSCATGHMNNQTSSKIHNSHGTKPATFPPHPVTNRIIDKNCPQQGKNYKGNKPYTLSKSTRDKSRGNNGKHALIYHKHGLRNGGRIVRTWRICHTIQSEPGQIPHKAPNIGTKGHGISKIDPFQ